MIRARRALERIPGQGLPRSCTFVGGRTGILQFRRGLGTSSVPVAVLMRGSGRVEGF
jgi:hypothetical protein